jgi:hypothetical protein
VASIPISALVGFLIGALIIALVVNGRKRF